MTTFETVFPILALLKDKAYNSISDINSTDIVGNGTGFFITEEGGFMSVGHNFEQMQNLNDEKDEEIKKRILTILGEDDEDVEFCTYEVADFYAVLVSENGNVELRKIVDYQAIYKYPYTLLDSYLKGQDVAIGKIDIGVNEKCSFDFSQLMGNFICGYLRNKIVSINSKLMADENCSIKIANFSFFLHKIHLDKIEEISFYEKEEVVNVKKFSYVSAASVNLRGLANYNLKGLSGSPVISDGKLQGIFFMSGFAGQELTHGYLVPTTNHYYKHIYCRYFKHLFVQPLEDADGIDMSKIYPLEFDKDKDFPTGEEYICDENGEPVTLDCFEHKIICK